MLNRILSRQEQHEADLESRAAVLRGLATERTALDPLGRGIR
jgi:hypothetical protein